MAHTVHGAESLPPSPPAPSPERTATAMTTQFVDATIQTDHGAIQAAVGSPVLQSHLPDWLRRRLLSVLKPNPYGTASWAVLMLAKERFNARWLDHVGSIKIHDHESGVDVVAFVAEPYGLSGDDLQSALRFAEATGCRLFVDACSEWFPTRTLRLTFLPADRPSATRSPHFA